VAGHVEERHRIASFSVARDPVAHRFGPAQTTADTGPLPRFVSKRILSKAMGLCSNETTIQST